MRSRLEESVWRGRPHPRVERDRLHAEADKNVRPTRLKVIHVSELPSGWLGKTHAMWTAGQEATGEWLLFTDADVLFKPDALRRAIAYAEAERADHVVLFPRMIMKRPGEKMMIAFFQALFVFGHRPWKVADPKSQDHMGVGAFNWFGGRFTMRSVHIVRCAWKWSTT